MFDLDVARPETEVTLMRRVATITGASRGIGAATALIANRVEPANMSDRRAGGRLLAGLAPLWPAIRTVVADAGHESRKLARQLRRDGWSLQIFKRKQRAFKVAGLTWIVERSFAWLGFNRRLSKDYECYVQTSETLLDIATIRLMLNRIAPR